MLGKSVSNNVTRVLLLFGLMVTGAGATANGAAPVDLFASMQAHIQAQADPNNPSIEKYDRLKHFGTWVDQSGCRNTREAVLARDEDKSTPLQFSHNGCTITSGLWHEPYTGTNVQNPTQIQIDHVVPLALAYYAGAYAWSGPKRCTYANFLANNFHLLSVSAHENMSKGDNGPDVYMPPNSAEHCEYVYIWMKIKTIWDLSFTQNEVAAIQHVFQTANCDPSLRYMDAADLDAQRTQAASPIAQCANFGH